jgi:hypothetical protein
MAKGVAINGGHDCYKTLLNVATNRNAFLFFSATSENLLHIDIFAATTIKRGCYISINILLPCLRQDSLTKLVLLHLYNFFPGESPVMFPKRHFFATIVRFLLPCLR